jgi:hypothetical protein
MHFRTCGSPFNSIRGLLFSILFWHVAELWPWITVTAYTVQYYCDWHLVIGTRHCPLMALCELNAQAHLLLAHKGIQ